MDTADGLVPRHKYHFMQSNDLPIMVAVDGLLDALSLLDNRSTARVIPEPAAHVIPKYLTEVRENYLPGSCTVDAKWITESKFSSDTSSQNSRLGLGFTFEQNTYGFKRGESPFHLSGIHFIAPIKESETPVDCSILFDKWWFGLAAQRIRVGVWTICFQRDRSGPTKFEWTGNTNDWAKLSTEERCRTVNWFSMSNSVKKSSISHGDYEMILYALNYFRGLEKK